MREIEDTLSRGNVGSVIHFPGRIRVRIGESCLDIFRAGQSA